MSVGARAPVVDGRARVSGQIEYVGNVVLPGMLVGKVLRSPYPHARIVRVDASRAARLPGVLAALGRDQLRGRPGLDPFYGQTERDTPVLALERVRYAGEPVAAVAAADADTAREALGLIHVEYEELPAVFDGLAALADRAPLVHHDGNLAEQYELSQGDVERALASADVVLTEEYRTPQVQGVPLEPHVVVAEARPDEITVYTASQTPFTVRAQLAAVFGLPAARVRVLTLTLGGGFGAKAYVRVEPIAALLSLQAGRPVRIELSRDEEFVTTQRQAARVRITSGTRADGTILAIRAEVTYSHGAYLETAPSIVRHGAYSVCGAYRVPNVELKIRTAFTNTVPCGPLRAPGGAQVHWARESHLDAIAAQLGIDPVALRLKNAVRTGDRFVLGGNLGDVHLPELLRTAVERVDAAPLPADLPAGLKIGRGCAIALKTTATPTTSTAGAKLNQDGSLDVLVGTVEMGQGARTVLAQIAADEAGLALERVVVRLPDTANTPFDHGTSSSRSTFSMGTAVKLAVGDAMSKLRALAADQLEAAPDDLVLRDGWVELEGVPERRLTYGDVMTKARVGNVQGDGAFTNRAAPDPLTGQPGTSTHYHQAVGAAKVAIDPETGRVRLLSVQAGTFAGVMINPALCELQVESSLTMGLGQALFEECVYDAGRVVNPSLADYTIPSFQDLPTAAGAILLEDVARGEVHGIGENPLPTIPPAIANAIANAVGVRIYDLPITPEKVLRALREKAE